MVSRPEECISEQKKQSAVIQDQNTKSVGKIHKEECNAELVLNLQITDEQKKLVGELNRGYLGHLTCLNADSFLYYQNDEQMLSYEIAIWPVTREELFNTNAKKYPPTLSEKDLPVENTLISLILNHQDQRVQKGLVKALQDKIVRIHYVEFMSKSPTGETNVHPHYRFIQFLARKGENVAELNIYFDLTKDAESRKKALYEIYAANIQYEEWLKSNKDTKVFEYPYYTVDEKFSQQECTAHWNLEYKTLQETCKYARQMGVDDVNNLRYQYYHDDGFPGQCTFLEDEIGFNRTMFFNELQLHKNGIGCTSVYPLQCIGIWAQLAKHPHADAYLDL